MPKKQSKPIVKKAVAKVIKKDFAKEPIKELPVIKKNSSHSRKYQDVQAG